MIVQKDLTTLDILSVISFVVGLSNYQENLSQSDKQDLMNEVNNASTKILQEIRKELKYQNDMLENISVRLRELKCK